MNKENNIYNAAYGGTGKQESVFSVSYTHLNMVKEVNTEGVAADEVLSDHVYEYNRTERLITM